MLNIYFDFYEADVAAGYYHKKDCNSVPYRATIEYFNSSVRRNFYGVETFIFYQLNKIKKLF